MFRHNLAFKLIYVLTLFSTLGFAQNELRVDYKTVFTGFKIDSTKELSREEKVLIDRTLRMMQDAINEQIVTLYTKPNNQFLLLAEKEMAVDGQFTSNLGSGLIKLHSYIYGMNENVVLGYDTGKEYIVKYENRFVEWTVTNNTKEILGFKCFKAVPKYLQDYEQRELNSYPAEVWFAPSINKRGGPFKYSNLPGLILEVHSAYATITASSIKEIKEDKTVPHIDKRIVTEMQAYKSAKAIGAAIQSKVKK
jgi:GLPGLI family protein